VADNIEIELQAMKTLVETLEPLRPEVRSRVIDYAFKVLLPSLVGLVGIGRADALPPLFVPPYP
jgi:hypothetical protein